MNRSLLGGCMLLATSLAAACDPVHQTEVDRLGADPTGRADGPLHRAGQPCLVCHGEQGPANARFTIAGTIYRDINTDVAVPGVRVVLTDERGRTIAPVTNDAGNFFVNASQLAPVFPVGVALCYGPTCDENDPTSVVQPMKTHVGREGSCASCHQEPASKASPGRIYLCAPTATTGELPLSCALLGASR